MSIPIAGVDRGTADLGTADRGTADPARVSLVLDSSAILAYLLDEPGGGQVTNAIASQAAMSTVNLAEVMTRLVRDGGAPADAEGFLAALPVTVHPFNGAMARRPGRCLP
jgi:PIN domain nuclease of toxin-antitoxin system